MDGKVNNYVNENTLRQTTIKNIKTVISLTKLSRAQFASKTGISAPTLTSYLNENDKKIMPVTFLMNVCLMDEVRKLGLNITINDLVSSEFDPTLKSRNVINPARGAFIGSYYCYYFSQNKNLSERELETSRDLRFGVAAIIDEYNQLTGEVKYEAFAVFYMSVDREKAAILKDAVDVIFNDETLTSSERNSAIRTCFRKESGFYSGGVYFSENHWFINLLSNLFRDRAMMAFYVPEKRPDFKYHGGLGAVSSVSRGKQHMPSAQKILLSDSKLMCSDEIIAEHLSMTSAPVDLKSQGRILAQMCSKLYDPGSHMDFLDDSDKTAIITARMNGMVSEYIKNSIFSVGTVSREEDDRIFEFIRKYSEKTLK